MPVMEYVRVQRLRCAVGELAQGRKLYDIALDYGFETQAGFYKAFQRHFGCSPTQYRSHKLQEINHQLSPVLLDVARERGANMQDRVIIRLVRETDAEDLWENVFSRNTLKEVKERIARYLQVYEAEKAVSLVAEVDGHVIGEIYLVFNEHPLRSHICNISDNVVYPAFHHMGIERRLLEECKTRAVEQGKSIMVMQERGGTAEETFDRDELGWIEYGRLPNGLIEQPPFWEQERVYDEVLFYLPLR